MSQPLWSPPRCRGGAATLGLDERGRPACEERRPSASREVDEGPAYREQEEPREDECDEELPRHVLHRTAQRRVFFP
jgi:hypothetical protein